MHKPKDSTVLNVCVFPDDRVSARAIDISQSLKGEHTMFVLGEGLFPHMTVYMARFENAEIEKVVDATRRALSEASVFTCVHTGYFMTEGRYLEASYRRSSEFLELHESLIRNNASLRINPGSPFTENYFAPYTDEQQYNAKETGYDLARTLYRPHVTLTRYAEGGVPELFPMFPEVDLSFSLSKVCIYKADDNGAVYELVQEFMIN